MNLDVFSGYAWYELWRPVPTVLLLLFIYFYMKRFANNPSYGVTRNQMFYFFLAVFSLFLVKVTPLKVIADHYLLSGHVFEVMTVLFIALPLFILSIPPKWARQFFWNHRLKITIKVMAHPWMAALLFNGALTVYFTPQFFNMVQESTVLMIITHVFLVATGFLMWWTITMPLPDITQFTYFARVAYVFLNAVLLMPIGIYLLVITSQSHYPVYEAAAMQFLPSLTAIYDQQLSGGILKAIQLASYGFALFYLIGNWGKQEDAKEGEIDDKNIRIVQGVVIHLPKK